MTISSKSSAHLSKPAAVRGSSCPPSTIRTSALSGRHSLTKAFEWSENWSCLPMICSDGIDIRVGKVSGEKPKMLRVGSMSLSSLLEEQLSLASSSFSNSDVETPCKNFVYLFSSILISSEILLPTFSDGENGITLLKNIANLNGGSPPFTWPSISLENSSQSSKLAANAAPWEKPITPSYGPSSRITDQRKSCTDCTCWVSYCECQAK